EMLDVALDQVRYRDGDTAKLRINDRLGGKALISVMAGDLKSHKVVDVPAGQSEIEIDVDGGWGAGAYVTAIVYRSMDVARKRMPSRAVGVAWLGLDQSKRTLQIALQAPEKIGAGETLRVPIKLDGLSAGEKAFVSVSAVDVGIVNLTSHAPANPAAWFTGQTRLSMEMRDYYGRLIDGMRARRGALRTGGDAAGGMAMTGSPPVEATIAEYSGIVEVAADGTAEVAFDLPDFNGRVRLSAMAWSQAKLGHAVAHVTVRDQVAVTAALPRFLTLGDETRLRLDLHNVDGPTGDYLVKVSRGTLDGTPEPTNLHDAALTLAKGVRTPVTVGLKPDRLGRHAYTINVAGPQGIKISRRLTVDVKPPSGAVKRTTVARLESGQKLTVSADLIADLLPEQTDVAISVGPRARFNVPGLLARLERYPYACAEQTISRVLPLVYANNRSLVSGGISAATAKTRVRKAIAHVLQMQDGSGGFGTWGPRNGEIWLTSYVIDFLTRVQEAGYQVPQRKLANALDRLQNYIAYAQDFERGGEARAYALYVLARNKRAPVGELRYYADERLTRFASPLAKAQLAAALGMVGDVTRARRAFDAAVSDVRSAYGAFVDERAGSAAEGSVGVPLRLARFGAVRRDYGSALRDGAAVLALAAETPDGIFSVGVLARIVADRLAQRTNTSTQEQAWLVVAANALAKPQKSAGLAVNGEQVGGAFERALTASELTAQPLVVSNTGEAAVDAVISITGAGRQLEPAVQRGYDISRRVFTLDGREVASTAGDDGLLVREVAQNDRLVIVVDVTTKVSGGRLMLVDHLPAGFEIENPRLLSGSDVSSLSWLRSAVRPEHTQFRDDRMVAAFNLNGSSVRGVKAAGTKLSVAYMVRAVSPGRFMRPGAVIEDMYRPETHARTEPGVLLVSKADQN
ncbi:MAG: alpha-2-macroglobulin family protein, partial [Pseudomonadota bacterium]